ncbi:MAG TPA: TonB-dependent receptor [Bacteroidota bacterium]
MTTTRTFPNFLLVLLFALSSTSAGLAQGSDVRGTVVDSANGERVSYATVIIQGLGRGAATNMSGFYLIPNVPPGAYTISASCIGYVKQTQDIVVGLGEPLLVNFRLAQEPVKVSETVVTGTARHELTQIQTSVHTMDEQDIQAVPVSAVPDIFHAIQILPGIVSTSDVNSHFYVRGGGGDQNLILLDGMKIYNPFHALGIFSIFDPDIVRTTEVYTGAFPPGYGDRLSSVVSLSTKDGNVNQVSGKANVNFLSSKLQVEGPIGDTYTWLADARKSFSNTTINRFLQKDLPVSFYDAFFKVTAKVTEDRQVRYGLQGFYSGDNMRSGNPAEPDYSWRNHAVGFTASGLVLGRVFVDAVAYETYFQAIRDAKNSVSVTPASTTIQEVGVRSNATLYTDSKDIFYLGFEMSFPTIQNSLVNSFGVLRQTDDLIVDGWFWLRYQTSIGPWQFDGGIHMDAITLMTQGGSGNIQPRLNVSRALFGNWKVKLSYGEFSQNFITVNNEDDVVSIFDTWIHIPEGLSPERAIHYVAGIDGNIAPELSMSLQSYFKNYRSLVVYNRDKVDATDPDYINATGKSYGAELLLRYSIPIVDFYGAYTWSRSLITSQGITYPPRYDRQHNLNLLGEFHLFDNLDATIRWEIGSGFPFSQTVGYYSRLSLNDFYVNPFVYETGTPYISLGEKNAARLPSYHRMDLGLSYHFRVSSVKGRVGVNVINAYDHRNIFYFDRKTGQQVDMLPFFPSATLELEY